MLACCCAQQEKGIPIASLDISEAPAVFPIDHEVKASAPRNDSVHSVQSLSENELLGSEREPEVFAMEVQRQPDEPIGVEIDLVDNDSAVVVGITPGALQSWNEANPSSAMQEHDRILEVNGARSVRELLLKLKEDSVWKVLVQ